MDRKEKSHVDYQYEITRSALYGLYFGIGALAITTILLAIGLYVSSTSPKECDSVIVSANPVVMSGTSNDVATVTYVRFPDDGVMLTYMTENVTTPATSLVSSSSPAARRSLQILNSRVKLDVQSNRPYAVLRSDGAFTMRGPESKSIFSCVCFTGNDVCQPFVVVPTQSYGCLNNGCGNCRGYTMTPHDDVGNQYMFVRKTTDGPDVPLVGSVGWPMTDIYSWAELPFAILDQKKLDLLLLEAKSSQPKYANRLVWTPYHTKDNKKLFVRVPHDTLPRDAFYYFGSKDPQLRCIGHCAPDDTQSGTCVDKYPNNPYVVACVGCATGCMVEIIN